MHCAGWDIGRKFFSVDGSEGEGRLLTIMMGTDAIVFKKLLVTRALRSPGGKRYFG